MRCSLVLIPAVILTLILVDSALACGHRHGHRLGRRHRSVHVECFQVMETRWEAGTCAGPAAEYGSERANNQLWVPAYYSSSGSAPWIDLFHPGQVWVPKNERDTGAVRIPGRVMEKIAPPKAGE